MSAQNVTSIPQNQKCQPPRARENVGESTVSLGFILWESGTSVQNFMAIHPVAAGWGLSSSNYIQSIIFMKGSQIFQK